MEQRRIAAKRQAEEYARTADAREAAKAATSGHRSPRDVLSLPKAAERSAMQMEHTASPPRAPT
jgi:hypothetical protein